MFLVSPIVSIAKRLVSPRLAHRITLAQMKRWKTLEPEFFLLPLVVDPGRAAVDVGANEGFFAQELSSLTRSVYAFEPLPWMVDALRRKLSRNVEIIQAAVSDHAGTAEIRTPIEDGTEMHGTSTIETENQLNNVARVRVTPCRVESLDTLVRAPVGFMKVDVEGHELAVLRGAQKTIARDKPALLIESERRHFPSAPECIFDFLAGFGYAGYFFSGGKARSVSGFSVETHQHIEVSGRSQQAIIADARAGKYINNFLFLPPGHQLIGGMDRAERALSHLYA